MRKKIFITDLDGTLFKDDKSVSQTDIKTLKQLRAKGVYIAIATGRSSYSFERALRSIGMLKGENALPVDYVIFSTGAGIMEFKSRTILLKKEIKPEQISSITRCFDRYRFDYMVHQAIPDTRLFLYKSHNSHNTDFVSRLAFYPDCGTPLKNNFQHIKPATEVLAIVPPGRSDKKKVQQIQKELEAFSVIQATSPLDHSSTWIEVFHKGVSKSQAAAWLCRKLGVDVGDIVAVGNDYNDLDMLEAAGQGFVVENAPKDLKQSYQVVSSNNENGVSHAAQMSLLI